MARGRSACLRLRPESFKNTVRERLDKTVRVHSAPPPNNDQDGNIVFSS
jgi:hypothetical protein